MLTLPSGIRIFAAVGYVDLRLGIVGLLRIVRDGFREDAFTSNLFVFFNRRRDRVKVLQWDRNGFWLHCKRLEQGVFEKIAANGQDRVEIDRAQMSMLLDGIETKSLKYKKHFSREIRMVAREPIPHIS